MLCYISAQYALFVYKNILLFFDIKKQSHINCCRILNINLVIGICSSNFSKLQMLPTPGYVSANSYPTNCRCFRSRPGIYKSNSSKLQMLTTPTRHLQIQFQQVADASTSGVHPYMYLQIQFQQVADASDPRICICKFISNKLQMIPTLTRHLQIQFQQVADASDPDQASANPIPASCRCFRPRPGIYKSNSSKLQMLPTPTRHLQIQFQQVADASDPDQASVAPKTTNQRCPPVNFLLKFAGGHLYCISISSNSYICLFLIHRGLSRPVSWHLFWTFPVFHRFPYALLWKSLPTRPLLLLSVPDGFCPR